MGDDVDAAGVDAGDGQRRVVRHVHLQDGSAAGSDRHAHHDGNGSQRE
ncbi:hypothetical protein PBRA_002361 [Plasmodiophora brassicae]|uniref:Uncharacterized protein n=1 Tax=Plasmodiophora brassicae TaxID=37360 RepID=A0A0G4J4D4_PLABS|nr:hypothetical protein PBRA_002361 [Plasmodiophora brassicae]